MAGKRNCFGYTWKPTHHFVTIPQICNTFKMILSVCCREQRTSAQEIQLNLLFNSVSYIKIMLSTQYFIFHAQWQKQKQIWLNKPDEIHLGSRTQQTAPSVNRAHRKKDKDKIYLSCPLYKATYHNARKTFHQATNIMVCLLKMKAYLHFILHVYHSWKCKRSISNFSYITD